MVLLAVLVTACVGPSDPVGRQVDDLVGRMTLEEKVGQMTLIEQGAVPGCVETTWASACDHDVIPTFGIGALLSGGGGSPDPNDVATWRTMVAGFQDAALASRLGIPMLYGVDAVHGHNNLRGAVIFPHNVGLGAAADADLVEAIGRATAVEVAATGIRWAYAPVVAVPQDVRWGRTYEGYGEETALVTELGSALVRGLQGEDLTDDASVLATPKHFVGDGGTTWDSGFGTYRIDQGITEVDETELRATHLPPYPSTIAEGARTIMASYSSWQNGKVHGDRYLLTEVLRGELGFDGFVVSDWGAVDQLALGSYTESVAAAVDAGIDLVMVPSDVAAFQTALLDAVSQGLVSEDRIDEAVRRILRVKFEMGLFETPMPGAGLVDRVGNDEHRALAREAVAKSLVILRTEAGVLPLDVDADLLVAGRAADDIGIQSGGWTIGWQGRPGDITDGTTILGGLEAAVRGTVTHHPTGEFEDADLRATTGVAVVGERPYAEGVGDSATLTLPRSETEVIERLRERVDRLVVVLVTGRPLVLDPVFDLADAIVVAWLPGTEGAGVADVLFGDVPVTGTSPYTWPISVDDAPRTGKDRCDGARYPVGHGIDLTGRPLGDEPGCPAP